MRKIISQKKSQSVLDFLFNYIWAILGLLIAIGALVHAGILDVNKILPEKCIAGAGFVCIDKAVISSQDDTVTLMLVNEVGHRIEDINVYDSGSGCHPNHKNITLVEDGSGAFVSGAIAYQSKRIKIEVDCNPSGAEKDILPGRFKTNLQISFINPDTGLRDFKQVNVVGDAK